MTVEERRGIQRYWREEKRRRRGYKLRPKGRPRKQQVVSVAVVCTEVQTGRGVQQSA
jgi:hypothetical protein